MSKRKSKLRIKGNDRGLMMICRDIRRRWLQYGENRSVAYEDSTFDDGFLTGLHYSCYKCIEILKKDQVQIDHIKPLGPRPRRWEDLGKYAKNMFERKCQALCKECHREKTNKERQKRKR